MNTRKLFEISPLKTLRFNLHYFGLRGLRLPVLVSRSTKLHTLRGGVSLDSFKTATVRLGFSGVGTCDMRCERAIWQVSGKVSLGTNIALGQGSRISVGDFGELSIGDDFCITARSSIICHDRVQIGKGVLLSWDNLIMDTDFHHIDDSPASLPICIGDHVWFGCRCLALKGASVPEGAVLAAGATVTKELCEAKALYGGVNKKLKSDISWRE